MKLEKVKSHGNGHKKLKSHGMACTPWVKGYPLEKDMESQRGTEKAKGTAKVKAEEQ